jgi:hypothetical protein
VLLETELARGVGGFDEQISILADWDFYLRLSLRSPVAAVDRPLVGYFVHADSMFHNPAGVIRELFYLEEKHQCLPDGMSFRIERGVWFVNMAAMAHHLGDDRMARRLMLQGVRHAGIGSIGAEMIARFRGRARPTPRASMDLDVLEASWLAQYGQS